jgi:hypothetical protein
VVAGHVDMNSDLESGKPYGLRCPITADERLEMRDRLAGSPAWYRDRHGA